MSLIQKLLYPASGEKLELNTLVLTIHIPLLFWDIFRCFKMVLTHHLVYFGENLNFRNAFVFTFLSALRMISPIWCKFQNSRNILKKFRSAILCPTVPETIRNNVRDKQPSSNGYSRKSITIEKTNNKLFPIIIDSSVGHVFLRATKLSTKIPLNFSSRQFQMKILIPH